jgi:hypothetical protein
LLSAHGADSRLVRPNESGGDKIRIVSLDDFFRDRAGPTLIKMDIEGEEAPALLGGANLIARLAPVLAISAYHVPTDLWEIPTLMHQLAPESELLLRHYTREVDDTVCYAVPRHRTAARRKHTNRWSDEQR